LLWLGTALAIGLACGLGLSYAIGLSSVDTGQASHGWAALFIFVIGGPAGLVILSPVAIAAYVLSLRGSALRGPRRLVTEALTPFFGAVAGFLQGSLMLRPGG
jgi:hypothetical protein